MADGTAPFIQVDGGLLTVRAEGVALEEILQEIARQGAIGLFLDAPLEEERVTANFADLPVDVAVRRLLRGYDYIVIADAHSASNVTVSQIWILGKVDAEAEAFVRAAAALLSDADWRVRHDAVVTLGEVRSEHAIGPLSAALRDADPRVREAAVEALTELDKRKVSDVLTTALTDDDDLVRARAAESLAR